MRSFARRAGLICSALLLALSAGCAAAAPEPSPSAVAETVSPSAGAFTLRAAGFRYGPGALEVPRDVVIERSVDQPNVVSFFFSTPDAATALAWFRGAFPRAGFEIDEDRGGALIAHDGQWKASLAPGADGLTGVSLRRR